MLRHDFICIFKSWHSVSIQYKYMIYHTSNYNEYITNYSPKILFNNMSRKNIGGGQLRYKRTKKWTFSQLRPFILKSENINKEEKIYFQYESCNDNDTFTYIDYIEECNIQSDKSLPCMNPTCFDIPIDVLLDRCQVPLIKLILQKHNINVTKHKVSKKVLQELWINHSCHHCPKFYSCFEKVSSIKKNVVNHIQDKKSFQNHKKKMQESYLESFPPLPLNNNQIARCVQGFVSDTQPDKINEKGCAVCGQLYPIVKLAPLDKCNIKLDILNDSYTKNITRRKRTSNDDEITYIKGPILDPKCTHICTNCYTTIQNDNIPHNALANGLWIGEVPSQLQNLSWAEKLLIARVHHNFCVMKFSMSGLKGLCKLKANAISYATPMPKIYKTLPPSKDELDDVLAFIYIGSIKPTDVDWTRTPFLVRHKAVKEALDWLKLNHKDYYDIEISDENLQQYSEDVPPVVIDWQKSNIDVEKESLSVNVNEDDILGVEEGKCPFIVHGITGEELSKLEKTNPQQLKTIAVKHFKSNSKMLGIGISDEPESTYNNPQLYPQMFPWLFPYGHGGLSNENITLTWSEIKHKQWFLMYHDKRFQLDATFCLIAFNHEQIKQCPLGGYLLSEKSHFEGVASRILNIKEAMLDRILKTIETD